MNKELALRTFGYLIGHYKTHDETTINSQEIEAINFILKDNENLEQDNKELKENWNELKKDIGYELIKLREPNEYNEGLCNAFNYINNKMQELEQGSDK